MNNRYSKVDFDNLPDIQELELDNNNSNSPPPLYPANRQNRHLGYPESNKNYSNNSNNLPPEMALKTQKFLRNIHTPLSESGMIQQNKGHGMLLPYNVTPIDDLPSYNVDLPYDQPFDDHVYDSNGHNFGRNTFNQHISCIDIANHVKYCMVCGRLYKQDSTLYIVVIIFLLLVCLILLKNVLNK